MLPYTQEPQFDNRPPGCTIHLWKQPLKRVVSIRRKSLPYNVAFCVEDHHGRQASNAKRITRILRATANNGVDFILLQEISNQLELLTNDDEV